MTGHAVHRRRRPGSATRSTRSCAGPQLGHELRDQRRRMRVVGIEGDDHVVVRGRSVEAPVDARAEARAEAAVLLVAERP